MEPVLTHQHDAVLEIALNRPDRLNALDRPLLEALGRALERAEDEAVRAVVLRGEGRAFSAGQDLREAAGGGLDYQAHLARYNRVVLQIRRLAKPVVAAVHGVAAGAGMALALAADLRVLGRETRLTTAFARIALVPDSGMTYTLPRTVGWGRAFELLALSPDLDAETALRLGLANRVVSEDAVFEEARGLAARLAAGPTRVYGLIKHALDESARLGLEEVLELEAQLQKLAGEGADHEEGVRAFLEKRAPRFQGR
ncbi:enoyl-CoA hydratase-related protein [Oceanithermus sp.]|uniref:enoyl-CoA hydratase-related protein n=1 Tax=Oceanithermus sp. TaxID=2268145 RepID=UPI00257A98EA|nr:enoyl-CoA hydratase-related protein [Oceanithermus sp.]